MGRNRNRNRGGFRRGNDPRRHISEMRKAFPGFTYRIGRDQTVTWEGVFQPNPSSPAYHVRVLYRSWGSPKVFVVRPALLQDAPHRYPDGSLCLYWPKRWRWNDGESIPYTIMAWAALWLEYYEVWQTLQVWLGPSSHEEFPEHEDDA